MVSCLFAYFLSYSSSTSVGIRTSLRASDKITLRYLLASGAPADHVTLICAREGLKWMHCVYVCGGEPRLERVTDVSPGALKWLLCAQLTRTKCESRLTCVGLAKRCFSPVVIDFLHRS